MTLHTHDDVWAKITGLATYNSKKVAAVAYVSSDLVVKFGSGDLLVTDASEPAVLAGQTSARVIDRAFSRGARIVSAERLHAKVMLFDYTLILGSANISIRSRNELVEAVIITQTRADVETAKRFVARLADEGQELDRPRIDFLLTLEATRPTSSTVSRRLGEPHIIFFKEILPGDVKKYQRSSADSGTGGGARDLRVSPHEVFWPLLQQMVSEPGPEPGVTHGRILSRRRRGGFDATDVELWRPTSARDRELRFSRIYEVPGWAVGDAAYERATDLGRTLFYVLEMDVFGTVFAKVLTDAQLAAGNPLIERVASRHSLCLCGRIEDSPWVIPVTCRFFDRGLPARG